jgi:hypothetical protein
MSDIRNFHEKNSGVQENNDEFYHYFATGHFGPADVYDGGNVNLNSGFYRPEPFVGTQYTLCSIVK